MLHTTARYCFRHFKLVIVLWVIALVGISFAAKAAGPDWLEQGTLKGTESTQALELLRKELPKVADEASSTKGLIVFKSNDAIKNHQADIDKYLATLTTDGKKTKITTVVSPFSAPGQISENGNGQIAFATVTFDRKASIQNLGDPTVAKAKELRKSIEVEYSGFAFQKVEFPPSELIGIGAALVILLFAFGSLVAAGLPIFTALFGIGVGGALVTLWSNIIGVPNFTSNVAAMISIGVGIDYALFIVTRYREALKRSGDYEASVLEAMTTAGAAVLFAGITVVISLLGMVVININFIRGLAIGTSTSVLVMVIGALTLLPALLGSPIGRHLDKWSLPHRKTVPDKPAFWVRWSEFIQRRAWFAAIMGVLILVILAIPAISMRVGVSDDGNAPSKQTVRKSYDLLAEGFGPGFNGPFVTVVDARKANTNFDMLALVRGLENTKGIVAVIPSSAMLEQQSQQAAIPASNSAYSATETTTEPTAATTSETTSTVAPATVETSTTPEPMLTSATNTSTNTKVIPIQIFPATSPQDAKTNELVHELRNNVIPELTKNTGAKVLLSGITPANVDFADTMSDKVPYFMGAVLLLSFLLLMCVFRSLLVPLKAVIMNMLSIGAAFGVLVAIFEWGWGAQLFGISSTGPIEPWAPMMLFAIVFGLSMDYEVFLLSKIKEEYDETKDNTGAVTHGLAATARVITAAALIMVCVFGSFVIADNRIFKLMGLGLSIAVLLDATVVRMLLVPATMELLGDKNWYLPKWLDKIIPQIHVEAVKPNGQQETLVDAMGEGVSDN